MGYDFFFPYNRGEVIKQTKTAMLLQDAPPPRGNYRGLCSVSLAEFVTEETRGEMGRGLDRVSFAIPNENNRS